MINLKLVTTEVLDFSAVDFRRTRVFTNGCFDILHAGHVYFLRECRKHGDFLIVGLNSDESIRINKGSSRPINSFEERAYVLSGLESVDYIVELEEPTPLNLIKVLSPEVLIKGQDWQGNIVGEEHVKSYGGQVLTLPLLEDFSTTNIISKIEAVWRS